MTIRITCPNPDCGRKMAFDDKNAGKKTRCKGCGDVIVIDEPDGEEELEEMEEVAPRPRSRKKARAAVEEVSDEFDEEDAPRRRKSKRSRRRDDDDESDGLVADPHKQSLTIILTIVAVVLFAVVGAAPLFSWMTQKTDVEGLGKVDANWGGMGSLDLEVTFRDKSAKAEGEMKEEKPEGMLFMIAGFALAGAFAIGFGLSFLSFGGERLARIATLVAAGASIFLLIWSVGWICKVTMVSREAAADPQIPGSTTTFPGLGLLVAAGASIAAALLTSILAGWYIVKKWVYIAEGIGLVVGLVILGIVTQPWTGEDFYKAMNKTLDETIVKAKPD